jgi:hypothetical protein
VEEKGLEMVVINPSFTICPALQGSKNLTSEFFVGYLNGKHLEHNFAVGSIRS